MISQLCFCCVVALFFTEKLRLQNAAWVVLQMSSLSLKLARCLEKASGALVLTLGWITPAVLREKSYWSCWGFCLGKDLGPNLFHLRSVTKDASVSTWKCCPVWGLDAPEASLCSHMTSVLCNCHSPKGEHEIFGIWNRLQDWIIQIVLFAQCIIPLAKMQLYLAWIWPAVITSILLP